MDKKDKKVEPRHGVDGWKLVEYSLDEVTLVATLTYERVREGGETEVTTLCQGAGR